MPQNHAISKTTRKAMKFNTIEGAFAISSDQMAGPYLGLFALALGATPSQIGMLNAFPALLGNILQIPYGILAERLGKRRLLVIIGSFWLRISWLFLAFLPLFMPAPLRVPAIIVLATLRITVGSLGTPAWTSIQAQMIPHGIRGKYYANRNVILNIAGLATTVIAGRILGVSFPFNYQTLFIIAAILGLTSTALFTRIPIAEAVPKGRAAKAKISLKQRIARFRELLRSDRNFAVYCGTSLVWNLGVSVAGPLVSIYFIRELYGPEGFWAVVTGASILGGILCQRYWGRLADRFGQKNVMSVAGLGAVAIPFLWFSAPHYSLAVLVNFWAGFSWGGYNLAAFNLILEITPDENRSMYVGAYNTLMGIATFAGPLVGGFLAEAIAIRYVFLLSFALRGLGLFLFNRNVDNVSEKRIALADLRPSWLRYLKRYRRYGRQ